MAEMYGKTTGCSGGLGGSMHLFDVKTRFYGGNAIVGGGLPLAVGLALADRMRGDARVTACFFGDGAVAEGEFHECLNLAALWQLPVLFCCENNFYAMGTALDRAQAQTDLSVRAASYGMPSWPVDGMDVHGSGRGGAITRYDVERAAASMRRDRVTPLARRLAAELGVDLKIVTGTGAGGAVRADDVRRAATADRPAEEAPGPVTPAPEARLPEVPAREGRQPAGPATTVRRPERAEAMRLAIARLMSRSKREIPHYYVSNTVDLGAALSWLRERNRSVPMSARMVPAALLLKAAALAAREVPELNGFWAEDHFVPAPAVHLGVAVSLRGGGLITPAIHDAADLPAAELMSRLRDLVNRARAGRVRGSELTDATITLTNLGDQGVESVTGVIYPPQVALVGLGKITERPWAVNGLLGIRPVVITTLAADHRADGYTGARYLSLLAELLQKPEEL
jgi:pyruvate dehydrogenase E2 component (dihydrolipoamide acetyltransferase)